RARGPGPRRPRRARDRSRRHPAARGGRSREVLRDRRGNRRRRRTAVVPVVLSQGPATARVRVRRGHARAHRATGGHRAGPRDLWWRRRHRADRRDRAPRSQRLAELRALSRGGGAAHRRLPRPAVRGGVAMTDRRREVGPRSRQIFEREQRHVAPGLQSFALYSGLAMARGQGCTLTDVDGNTYIDFIAGIGVGSVGHCHPHYVESLKRQIEQLTFGSFTTEARAKLLELLASLTPDGLTRIQFFSGGAEAVEAALRLAKAATGKHEVIGFWGGFHGKTGGVLGLLGSDFKHGLGPFLPGQYSAPYADCYRCPLRLRYPEGGFPLSGVISTQPLTGHKPWSNPSASSSSYGGNPLAAAAGLATLEIFLKEDLVRNSERVGKIMLSRLEALKEKYRCVGEVRGK